MSTDYGSFEWPPAGGAGVTVYANFAAFPATAANGTLAVDGSTHILYEFSTTSNTWLPIASPTTYSPPPSTVVYVDGNRVDAYTADGSLFFPYKTIQAGLNAVAARGDNSTAKPYEINIAPTTYAENISITSPSLVNLVIYGNNSFLAGNFSVIQSGVALDVLYELLLANLTITGNLHFEGTGAANQMGDFQLTVDNCIVEGDLTVQSMSALGFVTSSLQGNVTADNVNFLGFAASSSVSGNIALTTTFSNVQPIGFSNSSMVLESGVFSGDISVDADSLAIARSGARIGSVGNNLNINGTFQSYECFIRSSINVGAVGNFVNRGGTYYPDTLTIAPGGTLTNENFAACEAYPPAVPSNWSPVPVNVQEALDQLAASKATPAILTQSRFLDPNGSDVTGDGSLEKPWQTLTFAQSQITTATSSNIFILYVAPGLYAEGGAGAVTIQSWINIIGPASDSTAVRFSGIDFLLQGSKTGTFLIQNLTVGSITATNSANRKTLDLTNVAVETNVTLGSALLDHSIVDCRIAGNYSNGGGSGGAVIFENTTVTGNLTVDASGSGHFAHDLTASSCTFSGSIITNHTENLFLYDCVLTDLTIASTSRVVSVYVNTPLDAVTFNPGISSVFDFQLVAPDQLVATTTNYKNLGNVRTILADATAGDIVITLPAPTVGDKPIRVTRTDGSANLVTVHSASAILPYGNSDEILRGIGSSLDLQQNGGGAGYQILVDQRPASLRKNSSATTISGSLSTIDWTTLNYNNFGTDTAGVFTTEVGGTYQVNVGIEISGTIILNSLLQLQILVNGTAVSEDAQYSGGAITDQSAKISDQITVLPGDTVEIKVSSTATTPVITASTIRNFLSMHRVGE